MPLDVLHTINIIEVMENFLSRRRPPVHIRKKVDISYKIENQSIIIYEIRERFKTPGEYVESPVAKVTFVKSRNSWKVYWMRANGNWEMYEPKLVVKNLKDSITLVEDDKHHCFWG